MRVDFDDFWVDQGGDEANLRPKAPTEAESTWVEALIRSVGRATFFSGLSVFPVRYLDSDLTVFDFPPLRSSIAAIRRRV